MSSSSAVIIETPDGPLEIPREQYLAIVQNAEQRADFTAARLQQMGYVLKEVRLPGSFLLELSAVIQLQLWERQGLTAHLKAGLPAAQVASNELADRALKGWAEFEGDQAAPLSSQVLRVWVEQFAWNGQEFLQADIVVGDVDEDEYADLLAEFLWTHRAQLRSCPQPKKEEA